jgi:hypothetical protein
MFEIQRYTSSNKKEWNSFIKQAKNATFLFEREFMDYHADRFKDYSLMIYDDKSELVACLPANITDENTVYSHQGLTYGGFSFKKYLKLPVQLNIIKAILKYLNDQGVKKFKYKAFPRFYNELQTGEVEYAMFLLNAKLYRRDTALAIDNKNRIEYSNSYKRQAKKAIKQSYIVEESNNFNDFWKNILEPNLKSRFGVNPVHSLNEIIKLKKSFENQIRLFIALNDMKMIVAGCVIFETENVAHAQYISGNEESKSSGALNFLFIELIDAIFNKKDFFDFGIANEDDGKSLNIGLLTWKERMGGRAYSHDFYEIETSNYYKLELDE